MRLMPLALLPLAALTQCSTSAFHPARLEPYRGLEVRTITARSADLGGPEGVKDRFAADEPICVYSTLQWRSGTAPGPILFTVNCYRDGTLVYTGRVSSTPSISPWNLWIHLPARLLGPGTYRAELCVKELVLDGHAFEITAARKPGA